MKSKLLVFLIIIASMLLAVAGCRSPSGIEDVTGAQQDITDSSEDTSREITFSDDGSSDTPGTAASPAVTTGQGGNNSSESQETDAPDPPASPFNTNLSSFTPLNGTWEITEGGYFSRGSGDVFSMSENLASDFVFEADITFSENAKGAASLVFRSGDEPKTSSYVANIDRTKGNIRIFEFGGTTIGQAALVNDKSDYHMQVIASGTSLFLYVDGELVISETNSHLSGGRLGLLTFNSSVTYQNVLYHDLSGSDVPRLSGLLCEGEGVEFPTEFKNGSFKYSAILSGDADSFDLKVSFDASVSAKYTLVQNSVTVTDGQLSSGNDVRVTPPFGACVLRIDVSMGGVTVSYIVDIINRMPAVYMASEDYRPQIHFTPEINFMNDPNGLVYDTSDRTWHMFFQYSPQVDSPGKQTWGHAVSNDLVNWTELPIAMRITDRGPVWSGSALCLTAEEARKVPFFSEEDVKKAEIGEGSLLVAVYTTTRPSQDQSVAFSTDHGATWTQWPEFAIKHEYTADRDPKVFRIPGDDRFYLIVAGGNARLYVSEDLVEWTLVQDLVWSDGTPVASECPDIYPLRVLDRNGRPTGEAKWIYNASSEWYILGDMVWNNAKGAYNFVIERKLSSQTANQSNAYAAQTYYNDPSGRRITVHWIKDYSTTHGIGKRWNGVQSLPLETTLVRYEDGTYAIKQNPVAEVDSLREGKLFEKKSFTVSGTERNILAGSAGQVYEVVLTADMTKTKCDEFGFELRVGGNEKVIFKYDVANKLAVMDKRNSPVDYEADLLSWQLTPDSYGKVRLRAFVDNSVLEFFGNDGEVHLIDMYYPSPDAVGMSFFVDSGSVFIESLDIYEMKSIYTGKKVSDFAKERCVSIFLSRNPAPGKEFSAEVAVYPATETGKIVWKVPEGLAIQSTGNNYVTLIGNKIGTYIIEATVLGKTASATVNWKENGFSTNLTGWSDISGDWDVSPEGIYGNNSTQPDRFYMSEVSLPSNAAWVYEADVRVESGTAAGLVFGVKNRQSPKDLWFCLNAHMTAGGAFKLFKNNGSEVWAAKSPLTGFEGTQSYHLRVEHDGKGGFVYKIAPYGTDNWLITNTYTDSSFVSIRGNLYFGLVTYKCNAYFNSVIITH